LVSEINYSVDKSNSGVDCRAADLPSDVIHDTKQTLVCRDFRFVSSAYWHGRLGLPSPGRAEARTGLR
jgi:hypothetical protein